MENFLNASIIKAYILKKNTINTDLAPQPIGPYEQAIEINGFIYTAGQIAIDPKTKKLISGNIKDETTQSLNNLEAILSSGGSSKSKIVKITIFVTDFSHFNHVNDAFSSFFENREFPARSTVGVSTLPMGAKVEIECVAYIDK